MDSWLNTTFLEDLIQKNSPDGARVTIINFHVKPAVSAGNNFLGNLLRLSVECQAECSAKETLYLVVKAPPTTQLLQEFLSEIRGFEKEDHFYRETIHRLQEARDLAPRSYRTSARAIIMEDLGHHNFKMASKFQGLDLQHIRLVIRALARFHGSSAALYHQDPESMSMYDETLFPEEERQGLMNQYFHSQLRALAEGLERWPGYQRYANKIRDIMPTAMRRMVQAVKPKPGSFCVLNHGDTWVNNMLFHYNSVTGNVDKVKFIDFQILRFASPALDLQHVLYTSTNDDVRVKNIPEMLKEYHEQLSETLSRLGVDPGLYTLEQLTLDFEDKKDFGFLMICMDLSSMLTEDGGLWDGENAVSFEKTIASKRFREVFSSLIPHFERQGLL